MHIIEYNNYTIEPTQEAFLIRPIRALFNADRTATKEKFMQQLSVIYFMADPRSSYNYLTDEKDRLKEIILQEGLPEDFKIDKKLQEAIDEYKKHVITTSYLLLQDTRFAIDKLRQFLRDVDLTLTDDKGKPVYTVNSITSAIKQIPQLAKDIAEAERAVSKEIEEQGRARGGNNKTIFDDGIVL
jgi:uncharacterized protein YoxC